MSRDSRNDSNSPRRVKVVHFPKRKAKASRNSTGLTPIAALGAPSTHDAEVSEPSGFPIAPAATGAEPTELLEAHHDAATEPVMLEQLEAALDAHARVERAAKAEGRGRAKEAKGEGKGAPSAAGGAGAGGAVAKGERPRSDSSRRRRHTPAGQPAPLDAQLEKVFELLESGELEGGGAVPMALVSRLSLLGHRLFEEERLDAARQIFERLAELTPRDSFPRTMLGTIHLAQGRPPRALEQFEAALRLDGNDLSALVYRGEIRLGAGKARQGMEDLNRAVELGAADDPFVERARKLLRMTEGGKRQRK